MTVEIHGSYMYKIIFIYETVILLHESVVISHD